MSPLPAAIQEARHVDAVSPYGSALPGRGQLLQQDAHHLHITKTNTATADEKGQQNRARSNTLNSVVGPTCLRDFQGTWLVHRREGFESASEGATSELWMFSPPAGGQPIYGR